jgi:hypothetical protein
VPAWSSASTRWPRTSSNWQIPLRRRLLALMRRAGVLRTLRHRSVRDALVALLSRFRVGSDGFAVKVEAEGSIGECPEPYSCSIRVHVEGRAERCRHGVPPPGAAAADLRSHDAGNLRRSGSSTVYPRHCANVSSALARLSPTPVARLRTQVALRETAPPRSWCSVQCNQDARYLPGRVKAPFSEVCQESTLRIATWQIHCTLTQATLLL